MKQRGHKSPAFFYLNSMTLKTVTLHVQHTTQLIRVMYVTQHEIIISGLRLNMHVSIVEEPSQDTRVYRHIRDRTQVTDMILQVNDSTTIVKPPIGHNSIRLEIVNDMRQREHKNQKQTCHNGYPQIIGIIEMRADTRYNPYENSRYGSNNDRNS